MVNLKAPLYLASASPRRKKLLEQINLKFQVFAVDVHEELFDGEHPVETVHRLSLAKLDEAASKVNNSIIITADTIVVLDEEIIGKPSDKQEAYKTLRKLSGNTHRVFTGYSILDQTTGKTITDHEETFVSFRHLTDEEIYDYIESGSPMDKAGAYGIQDDFGAVFVERINGCYYNVVGLPLQKLYSTLKEIAVDREA